MYAALKRVLFEVAFGSSRNLDLCFDNELSFVVSTELASNRVCFFRIVCDVANRNRNAVVVKDLSGVVFVQDHVPLGKGAHECVCVSWLYLGIIQMPET